MTKCGIGWAVPNPLALAYSFQGCRDIQERGVTETQGSGFSTSSCSRQRPIETLVEPRSNDSAMPAFLAFVPTGPSIRPCLIVLARDGGARARVLPGRLPQECRYGPPAVHLKRKGALVVVVVLSDLAWRKAKSLHAA